ncbi:hypothetical protein JOD54_005435 [Actinokineospora baliensis]|nr:hypothetical protein [Actinokineospora baliensis]
MAGPQSRGRKAWPCSEATLRLTSPHTKQVHPIEQLAPATSGGGGGAGGVGSVGWVWVGQLGGWAGGLARWVGRLRLRHRDPVREFRALLDVVDLFCAGPLRQPWQDRKAGAEKHGPAARRRYGCRPPTQYRSTPSSRWHQRLRVSSGRLRRRGRAAGMAPPAPSVQWLGSVVGVGWLGWRGWLGGVGLALATSGSSASECPAGDVRLLHHCPNTTTGHLEHSKPRGSCCSDIAGVGVNVFRCGGGGGR